MLLAVPVALIAGTVSFFSPCVLPLLPGYLSYITGLSGADIVTNGSNGVRGRMVTGTLLFILGFSFVFVAVGGAFGQVGASLVEHQKTLTRVLGILTILLGLVFAGVVPWMQRDVGVHQVPAVGLGAAPLLGVLFRLSIDKDGGVYFTDPHFRAPMPLPQAVRRFTIAPRMARCRGWGPSIRAQRHSPLAR